MQSVVLITGMSGSGKSVALKWLEDAGYACVDNLPVPLLQDLIDNALRGHNRRLAVAIDARSQGDLRELPDILDSLRSKGTLIRVVFLDADDATLVQRYSESRRRHPLADRMVGNDQPVSLQACISHERELLDRLRNREHVIDTSGLKPVQLRDWMRDLIKADRPGLIMTLESFAYKQGAPRDADLVFDVRCLPNPHYDPALKPLTGLDQPVVAWLDSYPEVDEMVDDIEAFVRKWLPRYTADTRNYLTIAIGCTGGQHRSVYVVEALASRFKDVAGLLKRHRHQAQFSELRETGGGKPA
ncbi:MAG: RNase adapter RapZ [Burkholderiaceae bacterium]|nr:RNase adapter RapZ [Burkholderiaceae bacterium]MCD8517423.1 RNase adapter RapZ [Burkholderiaceae bacterium]MCD8536971.1 RNase adapter RapZ [Burkholderiaceae bacterium]MCD8564963.1 RNase adapter RapZ [Burkholderiaceae bacterium]